MDEFFNVLSTTLISNESNEVQCFEYPASTLFECKFNLFNQRDLAFEAVRQWFVLIISISMIAYFSYCLYILRKSMQRLTFDFLMIFIETIKLVLLLAHEFLIIQQITLLVIMIFQSQIRAIVCANFIKKGLILTHQQKQLNLFYFIYYGIIVTLNITILVLAMIPSTQLSCEPHPWSFHWFIVCGVDIVQSILILICSYFIIDHIRQKKIDEIKKFGEDLHDDKQYKSLETQIKVMSVFYLVFSFLDLMMFAIGNIVETEKDIFTCLYDWYLLIEKPSGSIFLLIHTLLFYAFSIVIWYIFFRIPYNSGLLIRQFHNKDLKMTFRSHKSEYIKSEQEVVEEIMRMSQAEDEQIQPMNMSSHRKTSLDTNVPHNILVSSNSPSLNLNRGHTASQRCRSKSPSRGRERILSSSNINHNNQMPTQNVDTTTIQALSQSMTQHSNYTSHTQNSKRKKKFTMVNPDLGRSIHMKRPSDPDSDQY